MTLDTNSRVGHGRVVIDKDPYCKVRPFSVQQIGVSVAIHKVERSPLGPFVFLDSTDA